MLLFPNSRFGRKQSVSVVAAIFLFSVPLMFPGAGIATAAEAFLAKRLQKLEAEKQIRDLVMEYARLLDAGDFAAFSRLFTQNGKWIGLLDGEWTTVHGPGDIRSMMEKVFSGRSYDPDNVNNVHLVSNIRIDVDGNRATGFSRWTVITRNDSGEPFVRLTGHYEDVYIHDAGRWKFLKRTARRAIP